tara:strand:- start:770 stop:1486 length:717 start_codon:yes stop_codon:yes gene_type:complete
MLNLSNLNNQIKFQIMYTNSLNEIDIDKTLRTIRDGSCTNIIKDQKLKISSKESVINVTNYFIEIASKIQNYYFSNLNNDLDNEYFYVYRYVNIPENLYGKNILYPSVISTSWNLNFIKDWAFDIKYGMYQRIKVPRKCNFLTSSFPLNKETWKDENEKYYINLENDFVNTFDSKFIKSKYELVNQFESEVILPPGKMTFNKVIKLDELEIYDYDFIETKKNDILKNINFSINEGTIL